MSPSSSTWGDDPSLAAPRVIEAVWMGRKCLHSSIRLIESKLFYIGVFPLEGPVAMPDFLVIGAPKAGTTALHAALARHPGLYMSAIKEPKFFLTDGPPPTKGGPGDALTYREHVWRRDKYEALFGAAPAGALRGEATPLYLYDRAALDRIRDTLPQARLIVIVR